MMYTCYRGILLAIRTSAQESEALFQWEMMFLSFGGLLYTISINITYPMIDVRYAMIHAMIFWGLRIHLGM